MIALEMDMSCIYCSNVASEERPVCSFVTKAGKSFLLWSTEYQGGQVPVHTQREAEILMKRENWKMVPFECLQRQQTVHSVINNILFSDMVCVRISDDEFACQIGTFSRDTRQVLSRC